MLAPYRVKSYARPTGLIDFTTHLQMHAIGTVINLKCQIHHRNLAEDIRYNSANNVRLPSNFDTVYNYVDCDKTLQRVVCV